MDKTIIAKISKCMALSRSSNEHEAAAAMRKAQDLMEQHKVTEQDVLMAEIEEAKVTAGCTTAPPVWLSSLANVVGGAFGVSVFAVTGGGTTRMVFVGIGPAADVAGYAFTVLRRKLTRARADFRKKLRGKAVNRTRRADLFACGWVDTVASTVRVFAMTDEANERIGTYLAVSHPNLVTEHRSVAPINDRDRMAMFAGRVAGSDVRLHHGVDGQGQRRLQ